ncbi:MAG: hypothetical protein JO188_04325 [Hyphomicrobiales bacterium]|nr:hypothetical protein [Hyphomicrobiales bacterium]
MKQASEIQVEDMITARMRRDGPDIERIGVQEAKDGWRCYWVWLMNDAPRLTKKERDEVLARANLILADLQRDFAIVRTRKPSPTKA